MDVACKNITPYVEQALDEAYSSEPSLMAAGALGRSFRYELKSAPVQLVPDLTLLAVSIDKLGTGVTTDREEITSPGLRLIATCEGTYTQPTGDPSSDSSEEPSTEPTDKPKLVLSKAERKYVKEQVYSDPGDDDYDDDVKSELKKGRNTCRKIEDHTPGFSRSRYIFDRNLDKYDVYDAINYLCPKYSADLRIARQTIYYKNNDVGYKGDDVRPGTYRTAPKVSGCYWARLTKGGQIVDNQFSDYASGGLTVTVRASDGGFTYSGDECQLYPLSKP